MEKVFSVDENEKLRKEFTVDAVTGAATVMYYGLEKSCYKR